jgi:hypothetical protein
MTLQGLAQHMNNRKIEQLACIAFFLAGYSSQAAAYIGPGLGVGVVGTVLGVLGGLLMLVVGIVWYPLKHLFRRIWPKRK